jgi:tetratricopeptide (TPR) repeat protein
MGKLQQQLGNLNESDALRTLLHDSERTLANLKAASAHDVQELLTDVEDAHQLLNRLHKLGADVRPERARLETLDDRLVKQAQPIISALGGAAQFAALRQQLNPANPTHPTTTELRWRLDDVLAEARRKTLRQLGMGAALVVALLFAGWLARPILFPPDPAGDAINAAQQAWAEGDKPAALSAIQTTLMQMPTNTQLLIWQGVLLELEGKPSANLSFDVARKLAPERDFLLERAQIYYGFNQFPKVVDDMNALLALQPESAEAYYIRGGAYEGLGDKGKAIDDITKASDIAQAQGNDALYATARVRLGMLMQAP